MGKHEAELKIAKEITKREEAKTERAKIERSTWRYRDSAWGKMGIIGGTILLVVFGIIAFFMNT